MRRSAHVRCVGPFVRVLLPVKLQGAHEFRFGVWSAIHPDDFLTGEWPHEALSGLP